MTDAVAARTSTARDPDPSAWLTALGCACVAISGLWMLWAPHGETPGAAAEKRPASSLQTDDPGASLPRAASEPRSESVNDDGMIQIPAGSYRPFYKSSNGDRRIAVKAFLLDRQPVTPEEFLEFVSEQPGWRRSAVGRLFAEPSYLADWPSDLVPGESRAQTFVSWFAARAYCDYRGKRLPTLVEWELAAAPEQRDATRASDARTPFQFAMGNAETAPTRPSFGSVWEWTLDFNGSLVSGKATPDEDGVAALFCGAGAKAVDASDYGAFLRYSFRSSLRASYALKNLGFRCAKDVT